MDLLCPGFLGECGREASCGGIRVAIWRW